MLAELSGGHTENNALQFVRPCVSTDLDRNLFPSIVMHYFLVN